MVRLCLSIMIFLLSLASQVWAQSFDSGSTGADGAFNPTSNVELQLPPDGVFNFTTVNIPSGVTVTFKKNQANSPVYILATGDVVIAGTIKVDGGSTTATTGTAPGEGGPGGYNGGYGGATGLPGGKGLGPGGGGGGPSVNYRYGGGGGFGTSGGTYGINQGAGGPAYGNARLIPLIGGSGGGGAAGSPTAPGSGGGGGGGAILIASSGTITVTGTITANGGNGYSYAGGGSGGAIRLVANAITGNGNISAIGGNLSLSTKGGSGIIRLEAYINNRTAGTDPPYTYGYPGPVFIPNMPVLKITSVAGITVPDITRGSYSQPDLLLPSTTTNPVTVTLLASNITPGTEVVVSAIPQYGPASSVTTTLTGTNASSSASVNVNLSTQYPSIIIAQATFTLQTALFYDGEKIEKVRVATATGKGQEVVYITESGKEIKAGELIANLMTW